MRRRRYLHPHRCQHYRTHHHQHHIVAISIVAIAIAAVVAIAIAIAVAIVVAVVVGNAVVVVDSDASCVCDRRNDGGALAVAYDVSTGGGKFKLYMGSNSYFLNRSWQIMF